MFDVFGKRRRARAERKRYRSREDALVDGVASELHQYLLDGLSQVRSREEGEKFIQNVSEKTELSEPLRQEMKEWGYSVLDRRRFPAASDDSDELLEEAA